MPRETIFTPYDNDPAAGPSPFQIQVGWQRDQGVQVGVATVDEGAGQHHLVDYVYGDDSTRAMIGGTVIDWARAAGAKIGTDNGDGSYTVDEDTAAEVGRMVLDAVTGSTAFGESVWAHLNRKGINDLIVLLRKARDSAFGKDA